MKLAYLIMIHKDIEQFRRLLSAIHSPENYYAVHVDAKSGEAFRRGIDGIVTKYNNVWLMDSQRVTWAGFSLVQVQIRAMQMLLDLRPDWEYFINLSGQCLPLKSQAYVTQFLARNRGTNFLDAVNQRIRWRRSRIRWRFFWFEFQNRVYPFPLALRMFPRGLTPYAGSAWFELTREACDYIAHSSLAKRLTRFYKYSLCPEEAFFQTVIMNSPLADTVTSENLRHLTFPRHSCSPKTYTVKDFDELQQSPALFARKFDPGVDSEILEKLIAIAKFSDLFATMD